MFDWLSFPTFLSLAPSLSSQYLRLFLKSSRSCVLHLLSTPFTSVICPSMASRRRQFLLNIWPIQLAVLCKILFRSALFSPIRSNTCSLVTLLWPFYRSHSPPAPQSSPHTSAPNFLVSRFLIHTVQSFKHNILTSQICSLQLPRKPRRPTKLLQLTVRWQYDGIMKLALHSIKSIIVDFLNQILYFSINLRPHDQ